MGTAEHKNTGGYEGEVQLLAVREPRVGAA